MVLIIRMLYLHVKYGCLTSAEFVFSLPCQNYRLSVSLEIVSTSLVSHPP